MTEEEFQKRIKVIWGSSPGRGNMKLDLIDVALAVYKLMTPMYEGSVTPEDIELAIRRACD